MGALVGAPLLAGFRVPAGGYWATVHATIDFETFSAAGFVWDKAANKWRPLPGVQPTNKGLPSVGLWVYAEHPLADVLTFSYDLADGRGVRRWRPGLPPPVDLFAYIAAGGLVEAHNVMFERRIWEAICVPRYGWPELPVAQLRCSMAKARAWALPGGLGAIGDALDLALKKDPEGQRLIKLLTCPQNPTKKQPRLRLHRTDVPEEYDKFDAYCDRDVETEEQASRRIPDLPPEELEYWQLDQAINYRGVAVNRKGIRDCLAVLEQAFEQYGAELQQLTGGIKVTELDQLKGWLKAQGVDMPSMDADAIEEALKRPLPPAAYRALQIRALIGSASVKKLYAMDNQAAADDRLHNLIVYHGARTGRPTGEGPQPLNLPKAGPTLRWCDDATCGRPYAEHAQGCPWCGASAAFSKVRAWSPDAVPHVLEIMACRSLQLVEYYFGDAVLCISGCVRGLFVSAPGHDLICSDYSAIEAVVTAALAGEQWRLDAIRSGICIYLASASRITGTSVEDYLAYKKQHGEHHPDRQKIGKPAELGLGFGGWLGAWRQFDESDNFTDEQVKANIIAWRDASPAIVEFWGGQRRKVYDPYTGRYTWRDELYGLEGAAIYATLNPGQVGRCRDITYQVIDDVLYCTLPSGRRLSYHRPRLAPSTRRLGELQLSFMTDNKNPKMGPIGWVRMQTYGGRLCENVVQAVASDILRHATKLLEAAGYPLVLHVYDEIVSEIREGFGSIEEFESLMSAMPAWAQGWPIVAKGGWRGKYYRKA